MRLGSYDWDGMGRIARGGLDGLGNAVKGAPAWAWQNSNNVGKVGMVGTGTVLGTRLLGYPLVRGAVDPEMQESLAHNPFTALLTGEQKFDPRRSDRIQENDAAKVKQENQEFIDRERAATRDAYREQLQYQNDMAYDHAEQMAGLEIPVVDLNRQNMLTAGLMSNSVNNYLKTMQVANQSVANILGNRIQVA